MRALSFTTCMNQHCRARLTPPASPWPCAGACASISITRKTNTMTHVLTFFIAVLTACSYYAMWEGMGVVYKVKSPAPAARLAVSPLFSPLFFAPTPLRSSVGSLRSFYRA